MVIVYERNNVNNKCLDNYEIKIIVDLHMLHHAKCLIITTKYLEIMHVYLEVVYLYLFLLAICRLCMKTIRKCLTRLYQVLLS